MKQKFRKIGTFWEKWCVFDGNDIFGKNGCFYTFTVFRLGLYKCGRIFWSKMGKNRTFSEISEPAEPLSGIWVGLEMDTVKKCEKTLFLTGLERCDSL